MPTNDKKDSLSNLTAGQSAYINAIELQGLLRRRIFDLGFIPGTLIECVRHGPSGSPIAYAVRGTVIALRREDAGQIKIAAKPT